MKRNVMFLVLACGVLGAWAEGERTISGTTLTYNVASGNWIETQAIPSGVTKVVKIGAGSVNLYNEATGASVNNTAFTGEYEIQNGYLIGARDVNFGTPSKLVIQNGGGIVFRGSEATGSDGASTSKFANTQVFVEGTGVSGLGAIVEPGRHCDRMSYNFSQLTLTGDTTFNLQGNALLPNNLDMRGHNLTISAATNSYVSILGYTPQYLAANAGYGRYVLPWWRNTYIANPGDIIFDDAAGFWVVNTQFLAAQGASLQGRALRFKNGTNLRFGTGTLGNEVTGGMATVMEGTVKIYTPDAVSQYSSPLTVTNLNFATFVGKSKPVNIRGGLNANGRVFGDFSSSAPITIGGDVPHAQTNRIVQMVNMNAMHVIFTNDVTRFNNVSIFSAFTADAIRLDQSKGADCVNRVTFAGPARVLPWVDGTVPSEPHILVGNWTYNGAATDDCPLYGILEVKDQAVVDTYVTIGYNAKGAVYLRDEGEFHFKRDTAERCAGIACASQARNQHSYGYLGMTGGRALADCTWFSFGNAAKARAFIVQRGGEFRMTPIAGRDDRYFRFGWNGVYANYALLGGTFDWSESGIVHFGLSEWTPIAQGDNCSFTVGGLTTTNATAKIGSINVNVNTNTVNPTTARINLLSGGTLEVGHISRGVVGNSPSTIWPYAADAGQCYLNFNGGVLKTIKGGDFFQSGSPSGQQNITRVTVFQKGATIDTAGNDVTWHMALQKPYGQGIESIEMQPTSVSGFCMPNAFLGPSKADVTSSTDNAKILKTADILVDFEDATRTVKGALIPCPGFGFTSVPSVGFEYAGIANPNRFMPKSVTMINFDDPAYKHGGLTKRGTGTLSLTAANTYGGTTRLEGGTLAFTTAASFPGGDLEVPAATAQALKANASAALATFVAPQFKPTAKVRITEADTLDKDTFGAVRTIAIYDQKPTTLPELELVASDGSVLPTRGWFLSWGPTSVKFGVSRGTMLLFR